MTDLYLACADLVAAVPAVVGVAGGEISRAVDLEKALKLHKKLAWQVFRLARAPHPIAEIGNVPHPTSMRRLLEAAAQAGIAKSVVERAREAFEQFESFIAEQGGDRDEVVSMISGLGFSGGDLVRLKGRKLVFRELSNIWGAQAAILVRTGIFNLGSSTRINETALITGYVGLQRLRRGASVAINSHMSCGIATTDQAKEDALAVQFYEAQHAPKLEVLPEFSSRPLPDMVLRTGPNGRVETELVFPPTGRAGAITLYTTHDVKSDTEGIQSDYGLNCLVSVPAESYVAEMLVPTGWTDPGSAGVGIYGRMGNIQVAQERHSIDLLPQRESMIYMGSLETSPPIPGVAKHPEAVRHTLKRLGWLGKRFDVYRCTVQYPVLHTVISLYVDTVTK